MKKNRLIAFLLVIILAVAVVAGCSSSQAPAKKELVFGVSVYNTEDAEVLSFRKYFEEYLGPAFDVSFIYSSSITETEDEIAFIRQLHEQGVPGIISFLSTDLDQVLAVTDELGMYYVRGSGSISSGMFDKACAHESFLGIIGPSSGMEYQAGKVMAGYLTNAVATSATNYLIIAGGISVGNQMHVDRVLGMLDMIKGTYNLKLPDEVYDLASITEVTQVETGRSNVSITIFPGYLRGENLEALRKLIADNHYDVILGALSLNLVIPDVIEAEKAQGQNIRIGVVDSFTEPNYEWFNQLDEYGNPVIDIVIGKFSATVGPSFAAMYNACTGHADFLKPEGRPFRLYQDFWIATSAETYNDLYSRSINIYDNIYSTKALMEVMVEYNKDATFENFRDLTEHTWL